MVALKEKRALFGGALRCAGLAAATVMTTGAMADFEPLAGPATPNYTFNYGIDAAGGQVVFDSDVNYAGGFPADTSYAGLGGVLDAYANASAMGTYVSIGDPAVWADAGAVVVQYFTVSGEKQALLEWELTVANTYAQAYVYEFGGGAIADYGPGTSGSVLLDFLPGTTYALIGRASISDGATGDSAFLTLTWIPAPGAVGLLGLGMLGTKRRRRRE